MIKENSKIKIIPSSGLMGLKLVELVDFTGTVIEDLTYNGRVSKGYLIQLDIPFQEEYLWFIPKESVEAYE